MGGDCHLGAHVVREAVRDLNLAAHDLLVVENVGNLVCPAEFDIGESARAVVLSVTEGEDKPLKYPLMFRVCDVAVLNKIDLLPHLKYDRELAIENIRKVNPDMPIFELSAFTVVPGPSGPVTPSPVNRPLTSGCASTGTPETAATSIATMVLR